MNCSSALHLSFPPVKRDILKQNLQNLDLAKDLNAWGWLHVAITQ